MPKRAEKALTDAICRNAKPKAARYSIPDGLTPGLELRVTPNGAKSWSFRYWTESRQLRRVSFGPYPAKELREARKQANDARNSVSDGKDPAGEKKTRIAELRARSIKTFADLADAYFEHAARKKAASTIDGERSRYRTHLKPKLGALAVDKVSRANVRAMAEAAAENGGGVAANRSIALVSVIYGFAQTVLDLEFKNPANKIGRVFEEEARARVLSDGEIKSHWAALSNPASVGAQLAEATALALKLHFLTAQRPGEVAGMTLAELDLPQSVWIIPAARTKNGKEHVVPLSAAALEIIREALALAGDPKSGPVFPSPRGRNKDMTQAERDKAAKPITRHALSRAMKRLTEKAGIPDAHPHDQRRTAATIMASERLCVSRYIVSRCLNHISDTGGAASITASTYARGDDLPAKRAALNAWAQLLEQITSDATQADNVVSLRGAS